MWLWGGSGGHPVRLFPPQIHQCVQKRLLFHQDGEIYFISRIFYLRDNKPNKYCHDVESDLKREASLLIRMQEKDF